MNKTKKQQIAHDHTQCIPNASIGDYYIKIFPDVPEKCTGGFIGYVGNYSNKDLRIEIVIDNAFMRERNYRTICFNFDFNNSSKGYIILTASFWESLKQNEFLYASVWHEVGHYHTNRYFNTPFEGKSSNKYRVELLNKGEIMPEEKTADLFAMYYTSQKTVVDNLNWLIKARKARQWEPDELKMRAVYELGRRKRYLIGFTSEKEIQDELCRLCEIKEFDLI